MGCFPEHARVTVPDGKSPIQNIHVGDLVLRPEGTKEFVPATVREVFESEEELISLVTTHGATLTTADQLFRCYDGKDRKTQELINQFVGYLLDDKEIGYVKVVGIVSKGIRAKVFHLHVDDPNLYIVDNFLVHNKGGGSSTSVQEAKIPEELKPLYKQTSQIVTGLQRYRPAQRTTAVAQPFSRTLRKEPTFKTPLNRDPDSIFALGMPGGFDERTGQPTPRVGEIESELASLRSAPGISETSEGRWVPNDSGEGSVWQPGQTTTTQDPAIASQIAALEAELAGIPQGGVPGGVPGGVADFTGGSIIDEFLDPNALKTAGLSRLQRLGLAGIPGITDVPESEGAARASIGLAPLIAGQRPTGFDSVGVAGGSIDPLIRMARENPDIAELLGLSREAGGRLRGLAERLPSDEELVGTTGGYGERLRRLAGTKITSDAAARARGATGELQDLAERLPSDEELVGAAGQFGSGLENIARRRVSSPAAGLSLATAPYLQGLAERTPSDENLVGEARRAIPATQASYERLANDQALLEEAGGSRERLQALFERLPTGGTLESSPALKAADAYFKRILEPTITHRQTLRGVGAGTALDNALALGQSSYMLPLVQEELAREERALAGGAGAAERGTGRYIDVLGGRVGREQRALEAGAGAFERGGARLSDIMREGLAREERAGVRGAETAERGIERTLPLLEAEAARGERGIEREMTAKELGGRTLMDVLGQRVARQERAGVRGAEVAERGLERELPLLEAGAARRERGVERGIGAETEASRALMDVQREGLARRERGLTRGAEAETLATQRLQEVLGQEALMRERGITRGTEAATRGVERLLGAGEAELGRGERAISREAEAIQAGIPQLQALGGTERAARLRQLEEFQRGGELERSVEQQRNIEEQRDYLRRQAIAESAIFGPLNQFLPTAIGQQATTTTKEKGGGITVLCGLLHAQGLMDDETYAADQKFGQNMSPEVMTGYHSWAIPLAEKMRKSKVLTTILAPVILLWAKEMKKQMMGQGEGSQVGKALMAIGIPLCAWWGQKVKIFNGLQQDCAL